MTPDDLPARLRKARKEAGLTQVQAAARHGCTQGYITDLETGRKVPTLDKIWELATLYGVPGSALDDRLAGRPKRVRKP